MGPGMFDGIGVFINVALVALAISIPLAVWKLVDLVWWAFHHVHIS